MKAIRLGLHQSLFLVAVALFLLMVGFAVMPVLVQEFGFREGTHYGPYTSVLTSGQEVLLNGPAPLVGPRIAGIPPKGTPCFVIRDFTDVDSAYGNRLITVQVTEGDHRGATLEVPRTALRTR